MANRIYKAGFIATDTPGDLLLLSTCGATITAGQYQSLFKNNANFTVTAGQNFYPGRFIIVPQAASSGILEWGYGDTIVNNSASAPTNYVYMGDAIQGATAQVAVVVDLVSHPIPANKALVIRSSGANTAVKLIGIMF